MDDLFYIIYISKYDHMIQHMAKDRCLREIAVTKEKLVVEDT